MAVYRLKKVGKHHYRKVLQDGQLGKTIRIPEGYQAEFEKRAAASESKIFTIDLPEDAFRASRPRYFKK